MSMLLRQYHQKAEPTEAEPVQDAEPETEPAKPKSTKKQQSKK